jgi:DNA-binding NarL/FixJ family response regulator
MDNPSNQSAITIGIIDDHILFREGVRCLLRTQSDFSLVGEASDVPSGRRMLEQRRPRIALIDINLPGQSGLTLMKEVQAWGSTFPIALTAFSDAISMTRAMESGASAYVVKTESADILQRAIRTVASGKPYVSPRAAAAVPEPTSAERLLRLLTRRESEVLDLVLLGYTSTVIGARLGISARTVETHRSRVLHKLGLKSAVELMRFAAAQGLLTPPGMPA